MEKNMFGFRRGRGRRRLCFISLSFFILGTAFVCWQEQDICTYGEYMEERDLDGEADDGIGAVWRCVGNLFIKVAGRDTDLEAYEEGEEMDAGEDDGAGAEEADLEESGQGEGESGADPEGDGIGEEGEDPEPSGKPFLMGDTDIGEPAVSAVRPVESFGGSANAKKIQTLYSTKSLDYLIQNFYIVNPTTTIDRKVFRVEELLEKDCRMKKTKSPQILIFHTHGASEHFQDSGPGKEDSVIGVGERLKEILEETYGYQVLHDETPYDWIDGKIDRNLAYTEAENALAETLEKYPTIEVMIDLHRDASADGKTKRVTTVNGKKVAQVMFFNGLSRNLSGDIAYLYNPNLFGNLAFSLKMKLKAMEYYEDFALPIFLKGYRYSLHLREKSLLIELGNEVNTVEEAKNAMEPLAQVLDAVLSGK